MNYPRSLLQNIVGIRQEGLDYRIDGKMSRYFLLNLMILSSVRVNQTHIRQLELVVRWRSSLGRRPN